MSLVLVALLGLAIGGVVGYVVRDKKLVEVPVLNTNDVLNLFLKELNDEEYMKSWVKHIATNIIDTEAKFKKESKKAILSNADKQLVAEQAAINVLNNIK